MKRPPSSGAFWVHLGLWSLAIPLPLIQFLSGKPTFFIAYELSPRHLLLWLMVLFWVPPLLLAVFRKLGEQWPPLERWIFWLAEFLLVLVILLGYANRLGTPLVILVIIVLPLALAFSTVLNRTVAWRTFSAVFALGAVLGPAVFVAQPDIRPLFFPQRAPSFESGGQHPVVILVFDEISLPSLLDENGQIDPHEFPNFARLASQSHWYSEAVAAAESTQHALPSLLSGTLAHGGVGTPSDYPINLFSLLGDYDIWAEEPITLLAPQNRNHLAAEVQWSGLLLDTVLISLHQWLPSEFLGSLPAVDRKWKGFWRPPLFRRIAAHKKRDRVAVYRSFLEALPTGAKRNLYFLHTVLPHGPWNYLPDGETYGVPRSLPACREGIWVDQEDLVDLGRLRYWYQLRFVDQLLGEAMDQFQKLGVWEEAVVAVVADHGLAFRPDQPRRRYQPESAADILSVPFFLKAPHQNQGLVSREPVSLADLLPKVLTLAEVHPETIAALPVREPELRFVTNQGTLPVPQGLDQLKRESILEWRAFRESLNQNEATVQRLNTLPRQHNPGLSFVWERELKAGESIDARMPSRVVGGLLFGSESERPRLALSVNGRIETLASTRRVGENQHGFWAFLPIDEPLTPNPQIEILEITPGPAGEFTLALIPERSR